MTSPRTNPFMQKMTDQTKCLKQMKIGLYTIFIFFSTAVVIKTVQEGLDLMVKEKKNLGMMAVYRINISMQI